MKQEISYPVYFKKPFGIRVIVGATSDCLLSQNAKQLIRDRDERISKKPLFILINGQEFEV